jgi:hypothetical protein
MYGLKSVLKKSGIGSELQEFGVSGAKAPFDFAGFTRWLKPPLPSGKTFSAVSEARTFPTDAQPDFG